MKTFSRITAGILSCALLLGMTSCGAAKKNLKILDTAYAEEEYAMAISKDNEGLKAAIDQALAELTEDGTIPSIIEKYIPSGATVEKKESVTSEYPELKEHWGQTEILCLIKKGIIKGDGASLNLTKGVTRAEFAALLNRALILPKTEYEEVFNDVKRDDWFAMDVMAVSKAGLMQGYDGKANPNDYITREQMAKMLVDAYLRMNPEFIADETASVVWEDEKLISEWAIDYINKAYSIGIMKGIGNNIFSPMQQVPREQAFVAIYRLING